MIIFGLGDLMLWIFRSLLSRLGRFLLLWGIGGGIGIGGGVLAIFRCLGLG